MTGVEMADLGRKVRIEGPARVKVSRELTKQYEKGRSIRELAKLYGRSYGFVHQVLEEAGVTLRNRGGPRRRSSSRN